MEGRSDELDVQPEVRVIVWSLPRTISTVLTKCVSFVDGINVHLEPYGYAHASWLGLQGFSHQELPVTYEGNEALFEQAAQIMGEFTKSKVDPKRLPFTTVQSELETATGKYVFVKDQSHAMIPQFRQFLPKGFRHVFLIREPSAIFSSYRKAMYKQVTGLKMLEKSEEEYDIVEDDVVGMQPLNLYKNHHDLWKYVQENFDPNPLVIDATDILSNPSDHIKWLLQAIGLPYSDSLLQWPSSVEALKSWKTPGEGILESHIHFYGTAMQSTCFMPPHPVPSREQLTSDVIRCADAATPYYQEMYKARLTNDNNNI
ncbi:uncharacterized protein LOC100890253 [Strongylocentrotus purpuratus]|uniref:Uncharacterized protein n=1 Tax=Strongylocentrotus purpuratus TaxID=7668 RepID=A0A7M7GMC2_STRPU|nr:uncharacterized protein LOC100890253 [Strongylocentrotus purpuratus]